MIQSEEIIVVGKERGGDVKNYGFFFFFLFLLTEGSNLNVQDWKSNLTPV